MISDLRIKIWGPQAHRRKVVAKSQILNLKSKFRNGELTFQKLDHNA